VLAWAQREFGPARSEADEGEWGYELQGVREVATTLQVDFDERAQRIALRDEAAGAPRVTLSLTVTGTPSFCDAFRSAFDIT
jgi:hypothetical protein